MKKEIYTDLAVLSMMGGVAQMFLRRNVEPAPEVLEAMFSREGLSEREMGEILYELGFNASINFVERDKPRGSSTLGEEIAAALTPVAEEPTNAET